MFHRNFFWSCGVLDEFVQTYQRLSTGCIRGYLLSIPRVYWLHHMFNIQFFLSDPSFLPLHASCLSDTTNVSIMEIPTLSDCHHVAVRPSFSYCVFIYQRNSLWSCRSDLPTTDTLLIRNHLYGPLCIYGPSLINHVYLHCPGVVREKNE